MQAGSQPKVAPASRRPACAQEPVSISVVTRVREQNPLPEGAIAVAVGLVISGVATYAFLGIAARAFGTSPSGKADLDSLSVLWTAMFAIGNGIMQPLEQEVARAVSHRRSLDLGPGPVIRRAVFIGVAFSVVVLVLGIVTHTWVIDRWFNGNAALSAALLIGLFGFCVGHLARGVLSSHRRFGAYARFFSVDGIARVVLAAALAVVGVKAVGAYGLAFAITPFIGVGAAMIGQRGLMEDGPEAPWSELTAKLGWLLLGIGTLSLLVQGGTIAIQMLATDDQTGAAGDFLQGLTTARIPLFLFQAVLASLLPKLSRLASQGQLTEFLGSVRRLVVLILGVGVLTTIGAAAFGPWFISKVFGPGNTLGPRDLALLAATFILIMATICIDQALVALNAHSRMAFGWLVAFTVFVVVTALGSELFLRVELGLLSASIVAFVWMCVCLAGRLRHHAGLHAVDESEALAEIPFT